MASNQIGSVVVDRMPAAMPTRSAAFPFGAGKDKFGLGFQITMTDGTPTHERGAGSYTWAGINNKDGARSIVAPLKNTAVGGSVPNEDSQGLEFGIKHSF